MALISVGGSTPPKMGRSGSANAELEPSATRLATRIAWIFTRLLPDGIFDPQRIGLAHDRPRLRRSLGGPAPSHPSCRACPGHPRLRNSPNARWLGLHHDQQAERHAVSR